MQASLRLTLILLLLTLSGLLSCSDSSPEQTNPLTPTLINLLSTNPEIKIYSMEGQPVTYDAIETAKIYGFRVSFFPANSLEELQRQIPELANVKQISVPILILGNGQLVDRETFNAAVKQMPVVKFHEGIQPQAVVLYGIENCRYTDNARQQLESIGIPYQYIDINTDAARYLGELGARMRASGYDSPSQQPYLEYNNVVRPRDELNTVLDQLKRK